jgi:predicted metal-binding membrane protein
LPFLSFSPWKFERSGWLTPSLTVMNAILSGGVLVVAGLYQWTPLKDVCLRQCQAPLHFIQRHGGFRAEGASSLVLGVLHGGYCIGCCWI